MKAVAEACGVKVILLITPETSDERIREIDRQTDGFIYMVSSAAVTGARKDFDEAQQAYFRRIDRMGLKNPRMIGFGISNRQTFETAARHAAGCIIGSRFVRPADPGARRCRTGHRQAPRRLAQRRVSGRRRQKRTHITMRAATDGYA